MEGARVTADVNLLPPLPSAPQEADPANEGSANKDKFSALTPLDADTANKEARNAGRAEHDDASKDDGPSPAELARTLYSPHRMIVSCYVSDE